MKVTLKKLTSLSAALLLAASVFPCRAENAVSPKTDNASLKTASENDYNSYLRLAGKYAAPQTAVPANEEIPSDAQTGTDGSRTGAELSADCPELTYSFNIQEAGAYRIGIEYYPLPGKNKDIVFSVLTDGELPFDEAKSVSLSRIYADDGEIKRDANGNDLRPSQKEVYRWNKRLLLNTDGYYDEPYVFVFSETGEHTVTLKYSEEGMLISSLSLEPVKEEISYAEYSAGAVPAAETLEIYEAEKSYEKSSSMLYPTYDRSSAATSPSHYSKMRYNTIGQSNWAHQGQWISWKINAPEEGWYSISFKARQNYQQGVNSYRTLRIDGEIPFAEVKNISFQYKLGWYMKTLSSEDGTPYLFRLTKGEHELSLEVAAGPMGEALYSLNNSVLKLNEIYRSIIMVTGTSPDKYRTYYLDEQIPELMDNIKSVKSELDAVFDDISGVTGTSGSQASSIKEMSEMLSDFIKKPLNIPERISAFKDNIETLGSLILTFSAQALELDYIAVFSESELPDVKAGFKESLIYGIKGFIASFSEDYNSVGTADGAKSDKTITVWISNGRDQAQILKNYIDNSFTPKTGIGVELSIVSTAAGTSSSTLVQAALAGKGPDAALFTPKDTPVNLAMRGALADVSEFDGYSELRSQFYESAWIPYEYEGGVYGVPETQNFEMLFYRTDIFEQLGLSVPQTWDDFYAIIELLQKSNLSAGVLETNSANAGISSGIAFFEKLLLQNGGTYYNSSLSATAFNSQAAYNAFKAWTELYTEYGLDRSFDFFNRFRTGEMPIGIMGFTTYNQLYAAAPEIRGLWAMTLIPGTEKDDGSIDRSETSSGTAAIMLNDCADKASAWEFIKWWTGAEAQSAYGAELEASLGVAARYDAANKGAFSSIGWNDEEAAAIKAQWEYVTDIKQIPGNYFISRCLTNAFRTAVDEGTNPVRALNTYNKDMNAEITRKRAEFGLDGKE